MEAFFLPSETGQRFCLYHAAPVAQARGAVIYLHPFAEEMNKARRMAALQARAMASAGFDVLQIDLLGCGDSAGEFSDASWSAWQNDVMLGYQWLRTQSQAPLILWGLRAGCLLAKDAAANLPEPVNFIFWQPVISGKQHWLQFLRLKLAAEFVSGQAKGTVEKLKQQLAAGPPVEIAGYTVSPALAKGLQTSELDPSSQNASRMAWLECSTLANACLSPVSQKCIEQWQATGCSVHAQIVRGPAFWQTAEIEDVPELLKLTLAVMDAWQ